MSTGALVFPDYSNLPYVNTYSDLPAASIWTNRFVVVLNIQGTWWLPGSLGGTFYNAGLYFSNGVSWTYTTAVPFEATLTEVNNGLLTDRFISPYTFENASKWNTKFNVPTGSPTEYLDGEGNPQSFPTIINGPTFQEILRLNNIL